MRNERIEELVILKNLSKAEQWFYYTYGKIGSKKEVEQAMKNRKKSFIWKEYRDEVIREPSKFRSFKIRK